MKRAVKFIGVAVMLGITLWLVYFIYNHRRFVITDDAFQEADIVNVSTQGVSGKIVKLFKREYERVGKGEPLFKVDDRVYREEVKALKAKVKAVMEREEKLKVALERAEKELPAAVREAKALYLSSLEGLKASYKELKLAEVKYITSLKEAEAQVKAAESSVKAAEENLKRMRNRFLRYRELFKRRVISKQQFEDVKAAYYGAKADYQRAVSNLRVSKERLKEAERGKLKVEALKERIKELKEKSGALYQKVIYSEAQLKRIEELKKGIKELKEEENALKAELAKAQVLLNRTLVKSPISGVIAKKWKEKGDFVSPGLPVYSVYDPRTFYVLAWIEEDKIRYVKVGNEAEVELETCKGKFKGKVLSVGSSAGSVFALIPRDTSQGEYTRVTQRVPVKIKLKEVPIRCIKPGTNATVFIKKE
ncbi:HlyD family secretion protein [Thermovibrio sp.]